MAEAMQKIFFGDLMKSCLPLKGPCLAAPLDRKDDPSEDPVWSKLLQSFEVALKHILSCPGVVDTHKKALSLWFGKYETEKYKKICIECNENDASNLAAYEPLTYQRALELFVDIDKLSVYDEDHIRSICCMFLMKDLRLQYGTKASSYHMAENPCYFHECVVSGLAVYVSGLCVKYDSSVDDLESHINAIEAYLLHMLNEMMGASTAMHKTHHFNEGLFVINSSKDDDVEN